MSRRSQYEKDMCRFCTKAYIKHFPISAYIKDNLSVQINDFIPIQLKFGIIVGDELNLFVHSIVSDRHKLFDKNNCNCGTLFYESINYPLLR